MCGELSLELLTKPVVPVKNYPIGGGSTLHQRFRQDVLGKLHGLSFD